MAINPPYIKLSNGDVITFEKLGPFITAVLSNSEGVLIRKGNKLLGTTEKAQANTIILGYPYPNPTIVEEVLTPTSTSPSQTQSTSRYPTYIFAIVGATTESGKALRWTVTVEETIDQDYFITIDFPVVNSPYARKGKFSPTDGIFLDFNENVFKRLATLYIEDDLLNYSYNNTANEPYRVELIETINPTPPPTESKPTPEKVEEKRLQTASNDQVVLDQQDNTDNVDAKKIEKATPATLKAMGIAKLPFLLLLIGNQVKKIITPALKNLIDTYIKKFLDADACPDAATLAKIRQQRDLIVSQLNKIGKTLNVITISLTGIATFLNLIQGFLKAIDLAKIAAKLAALAFPPLAASLPPLLASLTNAKTAALIDPTTGNSRLQKLTSIIGGAALAASIIGGFILVAIALLKSIDAFLEKCDPDNMNSLTPISKEVQDIADAQLQADNTQNETTYKGFIIEIEIVPYTPTVDRRRALGKNQSGILLIQTALSFTTDDQTLINELKQIIDKDNLEAY